MTLASALSSGLPAGGRYLILPGTLSSGGGLLFKAFLGFETTEPTQITVFGSAALLWLLVQLCSGLAGVGSAPMKKAEDYMAHADECRDLAHKAKDPVTKEHFLNMSNTWEMLAKDRKEQLQRQARLDALEVFPDLSQSGSRGTKGGPSSSST